MPVTPICKWPFNSHLISYFSSSSKVSWKGYLSCCSCFFIPPVMCPQHSIEVTFFKMLLIFVIESNSNFLISLVILYFNNFQYTSKFKPLRSTFLDSSHIVPPFSSSLSVLFLYHLSLLEVYILLLFRFTFNFYSTFPLKEIQTELCSASKFRIFFFPLNLYFLHTLPSQYLTQSLNSKI